MNVIQDFVDSYSREYDFFSELAKLCAQQCEALLMKNGIRAIVTNRAKTLSSLKQKIVNRIEIKRYQSRDEIYQDIVDLAGVRLALYFPEDQAEVDSLIEEKFEVLEKRKFPIQNDNSLRPQRFSGYSAYHYRVRLKDDDLGIDRKRYSKSTVEIQVASVLMHAWAEVEHDLLYKPMTGHLSEEEIEALDQLNGLVLNGELVLKQLRRLRSRQADGHFQNHYELAAYIYGALTKRADFSQVRIHMDSVDVLWRFLQIVEMNNAEVLSEYVESVVPSQRRIPFQIKEMILRDNPSLLEKYLQARREISGYVANGLQLSSVIKGAGDQLYWYGIDGKRYVFPPGSKTFETWYPDEKNRPTITTITDSELAKIPIGGNVTYRPGTRLIKIATDPKIYAVAHGGVIRWIPDANTITSIFGEGWQSLVDVMSGAYFVNYSVGSQIKSPEDYNSNDEMEASPDIDRDIVITYT